jgi:Flp pilus assembly protein TadD
MRNTMRAQELNEQGLHQIERGEYDAAEEAFRSALESDLFYPPAHNNLGLVLLHKGQVYDAAWEFQFAAKLLPHSVEPRHNLGNVMEQVGRYPLAEQYYQEALEIDPSNIEVMGHLARVYIKSGKKGEDVMFLLRELALRGDGEDWQVWARLQLATLGRSDE